MSIGLSVISSILTQIEHQTAFHPNVSAVTRFTTPGSSSHLLLLFSASSPMPKTDQCPEFKWKSKVAAFGL